MARHPAQTIHALAGQPCRKLMPDRHAQSLAARPDRAGPVTSAVRIMHGRPVPIPAMSQIKSPRPGSLIQRHGLQPCYGLMACPGLFAWWLAGPGLMGICRPWSHGLPWAGCVVACRPWSHGCLQAVLAMMGAKERPAGVIRMRIIQRQHGSG